MPHNFCSFVFTEKIHTPDYVLTIHMCNRCILYIKIVSGCTNKRHFYFTNLVFQPCTGTKNRRTSVSLTRIRRHKKFGSKSACYSGSDKDNAALAQEVNARRLWFHYMHLMDLFSKKGYGLGSTPYVYLISFITNWSDKFCLISCTDTVEGSAQMLHAVFVRSQTWSLAIDW